MTVLYMSYIFRLMAKDLKPEAQEKTVAILVKLPESIERALTTEAERERRNRQAQLVRILEERYRTESSKGKAS